MFNRTTLRESGIWAGAIVALIVQSASLSHSAAWSAGATLNIHQGEEPSKRVVRASPRNIAAGDVFRTSPNEALEVLFPDGTSLLLGPGSEMKIERFFRTSEAHGGEITMRLAKGRARVAGGAISRVGTLQVLTADSQVIFENASASIILFQGGTRTSLLSGEQVRIISEQANEERLSRPGFEVTSSGNFLSAPVRASREALIADSFELNPGLRENLSLSINPGGREVRDQEIAAIGARLNDEAIFEQPLPERGENIGGSDDTGGEAGIGGTPPLPARPAGVDQAVADGSGFGLGTNLGAPNVGGDQGSVSASLGRNITQNRIPIEVPNPDPESIPPDDTPRFKGPTTNRLFNSSSPLTAEFPETSVIVARDRSESGLDLQYVFLSNPTGLTIDADGDEARTDWLGVNGSVFAPFLLRLNRTSTRSLRLNTDGLFSDPYFDTPFIDEEGGGAPADERGSLLDRVIRNESNQITRIDGTVYRLLQAGFVTATAGNPTGSRAADNFFFLDARPAEAQLDVFGVPTGAFDLRSDRPERFIFATGDVDGTPNTAFAVHHFFLSAGSEGYDQKSSTRGVASGIRAFLRNETSLNLPLTDTGVLVAGRGAGSIGNEQNALLHADFALAGSGAAQKSTISLTIGNVNYVIQTDNSQDAIVEGRTVGSSHDNTRRNGGQAEASTLLTSPLFSTAAGGGNPDVNMSGRAGYLVLENFNPAAAISDDNAGGEAPLNGQEVNYAMLRLATATGTSSIQGGRTSDGLNGYVAGLVEVQTGNGIGIAQLDSGDTAQGLTLQTDAANNRVAASASLITTGAAQSITLGGLTGEESKGESAFIDNDRFAARDASGNVALVNGELVRAGLPVEMQTQIANYQHLQWGFFFGDVVATPGSREHVHLSTWIAGKVPNAGDLPTSGTATYGGHAIGNVYNNGSLYTAVGSYQNSWDFGKRQGSVTMNFDNATYSGTTVLTNGTADFSGRIDSTSRVGGVFGTFVQGGSDPAAAQMGRFSINETSGDPYRASGTFGAEKK